MVTISIYRLSLPCPPTNAEIPSSQTSKCVVLAFFGLLKNIDEAQLSRLHQAIVEPLTNAGFEVVPVLHTHRLENFQSGRSGENHSLNQQQSFDLLTTEFPTLMAVMEDPTIADDYFSSNRTAGFLKHGNFFELIKMPDPNQTLLYWYRQQYSLMRVTELWSRTKLFADGEFGTPLRSQQEKALLKTSRRVPQGVIYLRPDLVFLSKLNIEAFEALTKTGNENSRNLESKGHPWLQPIRTPESVRSSHSDTLKESTMHIAVPMLEHGGVSDRFAFGSPDVMLLYGARGLAIQRYVDQYEVGPHPETMLHRYLCEAGVKIHVAPMYFTRKRSSGVMQDPGAIRQREQLAKHTLSQWTTWLLNQPLDDDGFGNMTRCRVDSWWLPSPLTRRS